MTRKIVFKGRKTTVAVEDVQLQSGQTVQREVILHPGAAVIIPIVDGDKVCLVENHRFAVRQTLLELPAGTLDPGEDPMACAVRELEEETGYRAAKWRKLMEFLPSPGILAEVMHLYVAEDLQPGEMNLDEGEELRPVVLPWGEVIEKIMDGSIQDGKTIAGVLLWDRMRVSM